MFDRTVLSALHAEPEVEGYELCLWWDMEDGKRNSSLYSLAELAFALEHGTFTGCRNIRIEVVPVEGGLHGAESV